MNKECCSENRCSRIDCPKCARRYVRRVARDFQGSGADQVYVIAISARIANLDEFRQWRLSVWNIVTYRRQICPWWRGVSMRVWLLNDGSIRGVVALASITENEFGTILGSRWPMTLRLIERDTLHNELHEIVQPGMIMADHPSQARYQPRQMTVRPCRTRIKPNRPVPICYPDPFDEPMPILIV
jgi:hypothetical protein